MSAWKEALVEIEREVTRLSQEVDGRQVLPNSIRVRFPIAAEERLRPVLEPATGELGEALCEWAVREGHAWYRDFGPFVEVTLEGVDRLEVECSFVRTPPAGTGGDAGEAGE